MAFTTNSAQTQILLDNSTQLVAKFMYYTADGTDESNVLKVNVETLACRTFLLTVANTANAAFQPGDLVTGVTSGKTGYVCDWQLSTNTLAITQTDGTFTNGESLRIDRTQKTVPTTGNVVTPARNINIESVWYTIDGDMSVELGFNGVYANNDPYVHPAMMLSGTGYFGKNALPAEVMNAALNPTGNFSISTYTTSSAKASYSVIVEFRKNKGFAQRPIY